MQDNTEIIHISGENTPELHKVKTLWDYIEDFLNNHNVRKTSKDRYRKSLKVFKRWVDENKISQITKADLIKYNEWLCDDKNEFSNLTIGAYLVAVRLFYAYLYEEDIIPKDIAKKLVNPEAIKTHQRKALTEEQCGKLINYYKSRGRLRDFAMVNLMIRCGLRTIEVVRAKIEDICMISGKRALMVWGKGRTNKTDMVLLEDPAHTPIAQYLEGRQWHSKSEYLFVSESRNSKGERITTKTVSATVREGLDAIGLTGAEYTAHALRNTCATLLLKQGISLQRVQQVMRHNNMNTTQGYVHDIEVEKRIEESPEAALNNLF